MATTRNKSQGNANMQSDQIRKALPFWRRDFFTVAVVVMYVALACGGAEAWSVLSHEADAFAAVSQNVRGH
jgi:hypothetical protein